MFPHGDGHHTATLEQGAFFQRSGIMGVGVNYWWEGEEAFMTHSSGFGQHVW